jgi:hypothetical protein
MSIAPLMTFAAEKTHFAAGVNHWAVGAVMMVLFLLMVGGLLAFGRGRDHS